MKPAIVFLFITCCVAHFYLGINIIIAG